MFESLLILFDSLLMDMRIFFCCCFVFVISIGIIVLLVVGCGGGGGGGGGGGIEYGVVIICGWGVIIG